MLEINSTNMIDFYKETRWSKKKNVFVTADTEETYTKMQGRMDGLEPEQLTDEAAATVFREDGTVIRCVKWVWIACFTIDEFHRTFRISEKTNPRVPWALCNVLDLSWSSKKHLLSSSEDKTVRLWQVGCSRCLRVVGVIVGLHTGALPINDHRFTYPLLRIVLHMFSDNLEVIVSSKHHIPKSHTQVTTDVTGAITAAPSPEEIWGKVCCCERGRTYDLVRFIVEGGTEPPRQDNLHTTPPQQNVPPLGAPRRNKSSTPARSCQSHHRLKAMTMMITRERACPQTLF
ncbi:hypothetical protein CKAN_01998800 [Cinnamomum micranthum f. kanehirae]|uniref:Uncharacterized protein n=1 Tax=Cinnamomum micranthum f. kanehirae TaxID=337451 RepID=A0A3S3P160_9MAGN|nr:hypothetical protein CKAN_01998800 [Cinnamomum micranthum f. kanehirae]